MTRFMALDAQGLQDCGGGFTAAEISQQPEVWPQVLAALATTAAATQAFLAPLLANPRLRIVLSGAGSSAFIGECLAPALVKATGRWVEAVATTDIVSGPQRCLQREVPTLLVSFARSGNSPESTAAMALADACLDQCHHLVLTCNDEGDLYRLACQHAHGHVVLLPPQTHDRGFAMTSSFTGLVLAAAAVFGVEHEAPLVAAHDMLARGVPLCEELVAQDFERVIYLGSNELKGLAREAALKLLELSDGQVVASFDSPLGFRHGPKTMVNARTLVVLFSSPDPYTRLYDLDLVRELRRDGLVGRVVVLSGQDTGDLATADDLLLAGLPPDRTVQAALAYALFAQSYALCQSIALGLTPDNPSVSGTVNRVVRGVAIHPYPGREVKHVLGR